MKTKPCEQERNSTTKHVKFTRTETETIHNQVI